MIRAKLTWLLLGGVVAVTPLSPGIAHPLSPFSGVEAGVIAVQGWPGWPGGWQGQPGWRQDQERREHCWRLRNRAHEIRDRMYYAPPWERAGMERRLWEVRERLRGECWGMWREGE
jgi:hypothetical protein